MSLIEHFSHLETIERALGSKRTNLIEDHKLGYKPALIWQSMPAAPLSADLSLESVKTAIREGASAIGDNSWWENFCAHGRAPIPVFDGLASLNGSDYRWITEFHADGHFIAACWAFPEFSAQGDSGLGIADVFTDAFRDFGYVVRKVYEATNYNGGLHISCTLTHANELPMVAPNRYVVGKVNRNQLRWPVHVATSPSVLEPICQDMASQLMRAYGRYYRKP